MKKKTPTTIREAGEFLEQLTTADLARLLNTPVVNASVLVCAAVSDLLCRRIDDILDAEYEEMQPARKDHFRRIAARVAERHSGRIA